MNRLLYLATAIAMITFLLVASLNCAGEGENKQLTKEEMIARGKYLAEVAGCHDCHTPKVFTEHGIGNDTTRSLSGHPSGTPLYTIDENMIGPGKWMLTNDHLTAWVGPWGISYSANLTPDNATGLGAVSEEMFIKTIREGKIKGVGRPILPPMPWLGMMTDQDLKSIYAYLQSIPAIHNEVPQPVPPNMLGEFK